MWGADVIDAYCGKRSLIASNSNVNDPTPMQRTRMGLRNLRWTVVAAASRLMSIVSLRTLGLGRLAGFSLAALDLEIEPSTMVERHRLACPAAVEVSMEGGIWVGITSCARGEG